MNFMNFHIVQISNKIFWRNFQRCVVIHIVFSYYSTVFNTMIAEDFIGLGDFGVLNLLH